MDQVFWVASAVLLACTAILSAMGLMGVVRGVIKVVNIIARRS